MPESVWVEAEELGPLKGANFAFQPEAQQTRGSWSIAGPAAASAFTQGGESEFMSIASRADEAAGLTVGREIELPVDAEYTLWVRYGDYRARREEFAVRIVQNGKPFEHRFGLAPVVDELDPMKLFWDWSFGWDSAPVRLRQGAARLELYTPGPTEARRNIDCLCLTTDSGYHPTGRRKPDFAAWKPLQAIRAAGGPDVSALHAAGDAASRKPATDWKIASGPGSFLWNVRNPWLEGLLKPAGERVEAPCNVDSSLLAEFLAAFKGKEPAVYSHPLSGPAVYIPDYPKAFAPGSPVLQWLARHPRSHLGVLLNYGAPSWPAAGMPGSDRPAAYAELQKLGERFDGFISGEAINHGAPIDNAELERRVRAAHSRGEILAALRELHTAAVVKTFSDYYGTPVNARQAWGPLVSCQSADMEAFVHALFDWGEKRVGHESTGNSPTLARRLAFMRGAARQFGGGIVDYQSCNFGDSSMTLARNEYFYPASPRYVLDNSYDVWAGAGLNWLLKDYLLFHLAGASAFYHEEGHDLFWKPGGGAAGDGFPIELSPRGRLTDAVQRLMNDHPIGPQYTPVAFLLDEAHGWAQERFTPGGFGLEPQWNPALLAPGRHEASLRGWFDLAYYPAPETQSEPCTAVRQTYVNGIFGDLFDVIVSAPGHARSVASYPVLIAAGEVPVSEDWGKALREQVRQGGTLVVSADQLSGPGVKELGLPEFGEQRLASTYAWGTAGGQTPSSRFRYRVVKAQPKDRVLASAADGSPLCLARPEGKGQVIVVAVPLGLGIDSRPVPFLGLLLRGLVQGLSPVRVSGDVEWVLNRLEDGGWVVSLLNNRGVLKPQHGVVPTDHADAQRVTLSVPFRVGRSGEWLTGAAIPWQSSQGGSSATLTVPAGAVRCVALHPER